MKYTITTNENNTFESDNLESIKEWLFAIFNKNVNKWTLTYDNKKLAVSGINCLNEFSQCLIELPMGRVWLIMDAVMNAYTTAENGRVSSVLEIQKMKTILHKD